MAFIVQHGSLWLDISRQIDFIFVGFYEEIVHQPQDFYNRIQTFFKIPIVRTVNIDAILSKKINSHSHKNLPDQRLRYIANYEYENIKKCHSKFKNPYTQTWMDEAERILIK